MMNRSSACFTPLLPCNRLFQDKTNVAGIRHPLRFGSNLYSIQQILGQAHISTTPTNIVDIHTMPFARVGRFDGEYLAGMASLEFAASFAIALTSGADTFVTASQ
jgi:hypothetical protein